MAQVLETPMGKSAREQREKELQENVPIQISHKAKLLLEHISSSWTTADICILNELPAAMISDNGRILISVTGETFEEAVMRLYCLVSNISVDRKN